MTKQEIEKLLRECKVFLIQESYKAAFESAVTDFERAFFTFHLEKNGNNISKTAELVGMSRAALHQKIKKYDLTL